LSHIRLLAVLLALGLTAGCKAQIPFPGSPDPALDRRIEVMVRSQYNLPQDFNVTLGARSASPVSGYDALPVTISRGAKSQVVDFLISRDGTKLARLDTFDLSKDPAFAIDIAGRPVRGNPAAKVTVINFDDLECPYCARMHESLFPATLERYKDKVRFVYKDFPLVEIHPWAMHAAVNANCLAAQNTGAYWAYVDYLHAHGDEVTGTDQNLAKSIDALNRIARQKGAALQLDAAKLDACLARQDETEVQASLKDAVSLGLEGAPALFINGERIAGAVPADQVWLAIDRALRAAGEQPPAAPAQAAAK
jgi:protein-disulfide isomerase